MNSLYVKPLNETLEFSNSDLFEGFVFISHWDVGLLSLWSPGTSDLGLISLLLKWEVRNGKLGELRLGT